LKIFVAFEGCRVYTVGMKLNVNQVVKAESRDWKRALRQMPRLYRQVLFNNPALYLSIVVRRYRELQVSHN
jgi:hypothetical protein